MVKARGVNILLQLLQIGIRKLLQSVVFAEQIGGDNVDPGVRALGAHNHGDQQLPWGLMIQITAVFRAVLPVQCRQYLLDPLRLLRFCLSSCHSGLYSFLCVFIPRP